LMQMGLTPSSRPQPVRGGQGWLALEGDRAGHLYGQFGAAIVSLDPTAPWVDVRLTDFDVWAVGAQGIYVRRARTSQSPSTIWLHPWKGAARQLAQVPLASSSIAVDATGAVVFSQSPEHQVDLGLVELRSGS
jgi:hypothetical protein